MKTIEKKHLLFSFFSALILVQVFFLLFNSGTYGGADNIVHFQIARFAIQHPHLYLDHWGKPLFTTLLSPFTLFGYAVAKSFNIVAATLSLFFLYRLSDRYQPQSSIYIPVLAAFTPVYFLLATTCLTEILFSLVLVATVYLFYTDRFYWAALLLSFIPFVRTEGYILFPIFVFAFILKRKYWPVLLLGTGTILYSLAGYLVFDDIFWLINRMPYSMGESIYGSGSLFHFVKKSNFIFGIPFLILLVSGTIWWIIQIIKEHKLQSNNFILFVIVVGSWAGYFAAHSYVWWKGTGGSLGLIRVMGGIIPLAAFSCIKGIDLIRKVIRNKTFAEGLIATIVVLQIVLLFTQTHFPIKADPTDLLIGKSADFIRFNEEGKKIYYFNPLVIHQLNIDPYDTRQCNWGVGDKQQPSNSMNWGDLLVWDAHFGPNEGGIQLSTLENDPYLKKIKSFYPVEKVTVLGGYDYSVQLFKKVTYKNDSDIVLSKETVRTLTFENYQGGHVKAIDGTKVWEMDNSQEFSPNIILYANEFVRYETIEFEIMLKFQALENIGKDDVLLVFAVENENKNLRYEKLDLNSADTDWKELKMQIKMPGNIPESSKIAAYIWNKEKKHFLVESLALSVKTY